MSNKKISALSSASTPLTGSEIVPINQSSVTDSVSVANLTAGRSVSALSFIAPTIGAATGTNLNLQSNGTTNAVLDSSGNLLVGNATSYGVQNTDNFQVGMTSNGFISISHGSGRGNGSYFQGFYQNSNLIGTITQVTTTGVSYNTTSDRRLKSNITDLTNSGIVIDSLKPRAFTWNVDGSSDAGFIADELQAVLPRAVTGQPNATKEEEYEITPAIKDELGNITTPAVMGTRTVPDYQMIDASQPELIAYLVAEVQSLRARLKAANIA